MLAISVSADQILSTVTDSTNENPCVNPNAEIISYHIHALFWASNPASVKKAMDFQRAFYTEFDLEDGKNCTITEGDPGVGVTDICPFSTYWLPEGPFLTAHIGFFIPGGQYEKTVKWTMQNREDLDILVHPNSGCEVEDHTVWAMWGGTPWELDTSIFSCEYPGCVPKDMLKY